MMLSSLAFVLSTLVAAPHANVDAPWKEDAVQLDSIGVLAFGPQGVLFVGDAEGASVLALETGDTESTEPLADFDIDHLTERLADLTGASPDQIRIHDLAVNPISARAYLSVTRGSGSEAQALLVRIHGADEIEVLELSGMRHMRLDLNDAPEAGGSGRRNQRAMSVTDLGYHDGMLYVAGLSNEEFASKLRAFAFPFDGKNHGTSVEVYHGNHGSWETRSPIRTFLPMDIAGEAHLLAGYTCTPLVTFAVKELTPNAKLRGKTVAELGGGNTPLDMLLYEKEGAKHLLIANSSRGVMKVPTAGLADQEEITTRITGTAGLAYETIEELSQVTQLAAFGAARALVLIEDDGTTSLQTIDLP